MTQAARDKIIPNTNNLVSIHCHKNGGGPYVDTGIYWRSPQK
jgi:hypothetical protein